MDSRQRVFRALEFGRPDRVPRQVWALPWVSLFAADELAALLRDYPMDFAGAGEFLGRGERERGQRARKGRYVDEWGCQWEAAEEGVIGEVKGPPLADFSALAAYQPPWEVLDGADWDAIDRAQEANLASGNPRFMLVGGAQPFERMQYLRGSERLYLDLGEESAQLGRLMEMVHEYYLRLIERASAGGCDGVQFSDDWGSQRGLLIRPEQWRRLFKPLYAEYCRIIRGAGKKVFMHSDGHIAAIYDDLIEIGVDAINSQLFCMDIEELGARYKGRITFWGEIDRQGILPLGSVEQVRSAVGRVRRALQDDRGGVIAQCEWGVANPAENVRAVFEAWDEPLESLPR